MNQLILIGRVKKILKSELTLVLTVSRPRSMSDVDHINISYHQHIAEVIEKLAVGAMVGIKGRLVVEEGAIGVVLEKITVISEDENSEA